jgi:hypothetical protein
MRYRIAPKTIERESTCPAPTLCVLVSFVIVTSPSSPAERLAGLIDALCAAIAAHGVRGLLTAPLQLLLWSRLRRMAGRARCLAARMAAGAPLSTSRSRAASRSAPTRPYIRLPRGLTWLVRVVPGTASGAASLQFLLSDPEMAAVADSPPMRRLLRPLCRMLGVAPPPIKPPPQTTAPMPTANEPPRPPPEPLQAEPPAPVLSRNAT